MDPVDLAPPGGTKWLLNQKDRGWRGRFRLRKTADQTPAMQSRDKAIAEAWQEKASSEKPSSEKPPQAAQRRTRGSEDPLQFTCCLCRDSAEYVPRDLVGHFKAQHRGSPAVFCCQTCTFRTHQLSYFQVHQLSHKDTLSSCALCQDNVQRTWVEFQAHLTAYHFQNGRYSCQICPKFSTGEVGLFLEHTYAHSLTLEGAEEDKCAAQKSFCLQASAPTLRCQQCGYEVSRKLLINDDIQAIHICSGDGLKEEGVCPALAKANHGPRTQLRLTRSTVREMCWLTQDCLALPGREFLDKYCHLSDPHATLAETQHFLMESVAGETADPTWTKALQSVLSNVPQEINLHPMSEKSSSSDLAVLTVENKITVAQNGATYCKRLKRTSGSIADGALGLGGQNGCQAESDTCGKAPECIRTLENRKRRENGIQVCSELKLANKRGASTPRCKSAKKRRKRQNVRRKRRAGRKKADRKVPGLPLKIVLKKNPVKEKQWVSQSCEGPPESRVLQAGLEDTTNCESSKPEPSERCEALAGTPPAEPEVSSQADAGPRLEDAMLSSPAAGAGGWDADLGPEGVLGPGSQRAPSSSTTSAPSQLVITLQGDRNGGVLGAAVSPEKTEERTQDEAASADSEPGLCSHGDVATALALQPEWRPAPKSVERILKLVAINPYQPVRHPAGNQPVVVLNHPDADVPEVARVMEVINRYKGAVRKVALSRRTLNALCGASGALREAEDAMGGPPQPGEGGSSVQERFLLRLKLRRLSKKKYQVVAGQSPSREPALRLGCWFCGRVFTTQEMWVTHRQRHLMEWK